MFIDRISNSISKSFALLAVMFCFGILFGPLAIGISTSTFAILLGVSLSCFVFTPPAKEGKGEVSSGSSKRKLIRLLSLALFFLLFGLFRYAQSEIPKDIPTVRDHVGSVIRVEGDVIAEPGMGAKSQQVTIGSVRVADQPVFGNMLVSIPFENPLLSKEGAGGGVAYGDHLVFSCSIQIPRPFSGFAYDRFLQAKGTLALCRFPKNIEIENPLLSKEGAGGGVAFSIVGSILSFKHNIVDKMKQIFPEPHASFLFGLVFGGNVGLDKEVQDDFAKTGTSHILAASGFNVSLFTFVFFGFVISFLGKKRGAIATAILLVAYVIMAGATAAVVRAAVFGAVLLVGSVIDRRAHVVNALLLTASIMLFWNPRWLLDDVGFQLSFVAFAAIMFLAPRLEEKLEFVPERFGIRDALAGSLSAIILTLPIILWQFGSISLVAPFANVFVLPLLPFLMFYTIAILPIAWLSTSIGQLVALPSLWGSKYILAMISIFASPSFASVSVPSAQVVAVIVAVLMVIVSLIYSRKR